MHFRKRERAHSKLNEICICISITDRREENKKSKCKIEPTIKKKRIMVKRTFHRRVLILIIVFRVFFVSLCCVCVLSQSAFVIYASGLWTINTCFARQFSRSIYSIDIFLKKKNKKKKRNPIAPLQTFLMIRNNGKKKL